MSNEEFELNCSVRTDFGKGASRRLRRLNDSIPAYIFRQQLKVIDIYILEIVEFELKIKL